MIERPYGEEKVMDSVERREVRRDGNDQDESNAHQKKYFENETD